MSIDQRKELKGMIGAHDEELINKTINRITEAFVHEEFNPLETTEEFLMRIGEKVRAEMIQEIKSQTMAAVQGERE